MSGTIRYSLRVTDLFGTRRRTPVDGGGSIDVAADERSAGVLKPITTGQGTAVPVASIGSVGWLYLRNDDPTNFVTWGPDSGGNLVAVGKLLPGEEAWFRVLAGVTVRVKSDTAVCDTTFELWSF